MLKPLGLTHGHYECRSLGETLPVFTDLLAMKVVAHSNGEAVVQHRIPTGGWWCTKPGPAHPTSRTTTTTACGVANAEEVDAAHAYLEANKERYGLRRVSPPRSQHFARSVYFEEPGGNTLEIEHYEPQAAAEGRTIARPHWNRELKERDFPGRGYVPQALTHGTLECDDKEASAAFYSGVLGLQIAGGGRLSVYIKHAATPWYLVVLPIKRRKKFLSPANRFTLTLGSAKEVEDAHAELRLAKGVTGFSRCSGATAALRLSSRI